MKIFRSIKIVWRVLRDPGAAAAALAQGNFWFDQAKQAKADFDAAEEAADLRAMKAAYARLTLAKERFERETEALLK